MSTRREEIAEQRRALTKRPPLVNAGDTITVVILLFVLQITHTLNTDWLGTAFILVGWVIGDMVLNLVLRSRRLWTTWTTSPLPTSAGRCP